MEICWIGTLAEVDLIFFFSFFRQNHTQANNPNTEQTSETADTSQETVTTPGPPADQEESSGTE